MPRPARSIDESESGSETQHLGFLLLPEFPIYALMPAIEALRIANQNSGRSLFRWQLFSADGGAVSAGNGMRVNVDAAVADVPWHPMVLVCGGNHPLQSVNKRILDWLRRLARHGSTLGAIDTGAFALAKAGLLKGYRVTLHWEGLTTFRDRFPEIETCEQLFAVDRDRITCAGGHAALDLMLHLIERRHGFELAQIVANGFVAQRIRRENEPQRVEAAQVAGNDRSAFARIVRDMESNIGTPLSAARLARHAGTSLRALDRIVRDHVGEAPMRYYRKVRLQAARNALFYSDVPIHEVARSCGFSSPEILSRSFRAHFGLSPSAFRARFSSEQLRRFRPELWQSLDFEGPGRRR